MSCEFWAPVPSATLALLIDGSADVQCKFEQERSPESLDDVVIRRMPGIERGPTRSMGNGSAAQQPSRPQKGIHRAIDSIVSTSRLLHESDLADLPYL
ncbi:hypothetical protein PR202_ga12046 [Eleusine coracana subsp. coracana]|uniref:Uncharacterized protein n=1 Tax=Eleusine coracana subsp. coracana TaxID=191504 RepID=A0AAV5CB39_ELECO|nr:hypothetical protein PR202_ga12046 [Eleusine coracana subsp. coracana]